MKRRDHKPKRSAVNRHRGAVLKKTLGVLIATILIVGTVIGAVGMDNLFTMHAEAGTTHPVVMYVGRSDMADEARDGNVHIDLDTFGDIFTYDIMAYVTDNADQVVLRVPLDDTEVALPPDGGMTRRYPVQRVGTDGGPGEPFFALDAEIVQAEGDTVPSFIREDTENETTLFDVLACTLREHELEIRVNVTQPVPETITAQNDGKTAAAPEVPAAEDPPAQDAETPPAQDADGTETPDTASKEATPAVPAAEGAVPEVPAAEEAVRQEAAVPEVPAAEEVLTREPAVSAEQAANGGPEPGTVLCEELRGNWLHVTFDAKIPQRYAANPETAALLMKQCEAPESIVTDNGGVMTQESHAGIKGKATYAVSPAPEDGTGNVFSNEVTVMPGKRSVRFFCRLEGGDGSNIAESDMLRGVLGLFLRSRTNPADERNMTLAFDQRLDIKQDVTDPTRWETVWRSLPVPDADQEYVLRVLDPETGAYSEEAYVAYDDNEEQEIRIEGYTAPGQRTMKARVLGARSLRTAGDDVTVYAKIKWEGDENPNPPESVALTVTGDTGDDTAVSDTVYTIGRDGKVTKAGETEEDALSVAQIDEGEWNVEIGGLPKITTPAEPQTTPQSGDPAEETEVETPKDITYVLSSGSAEAKTGAYTRSESGTGTQEDPFTVTYTYQAPAATVTMPAVSLNVNGAAEAELETITEVVTYNITTTVPDDPNATLMTITDELKGGMQFAGTKGDVRVEVEGNAVTIDETTGLTDPADASVTYQAIRTEDQKLNVYIPVDGNTRGKQVTVSFRAAIKDGITYEALAAVYKDAKVPNEAESYAGTFSQPKMGTAKSATVTIQPVRDLAAAAEAGDITMSVNGDPAHADLAARDDLFTYLIETTVPEGAKSMLVTDTLVPVLKNMSKQDEIVVKLGDKIITPSTEVVEDGVSHKAITLEGQTVQVRIPLAEDDGDAGKKVSVQLKAVIRSDMDLSSYESADGKIPNEASVMVDGDTEKTKKSNQVTVRPPDTAGVTKTVNGKETYTLEEDSDLLSYSITARIPLDAETYTLTDSVPDVLVIKSASAKVGGRSMGSTNLKRKGQDVYLTLPDATAYAGETVEMRVKTKMVQGADLALYNNHKVPNTVTVNVNGRVYETSEPATVDGEVLGMRRRGGQTGEESEIPRLIVIVCALITLIILARHRIEY
ncbi:MAG: isopeptide-forming domain-containing fimbrial protein [Lachnospiraceae bacterium]|nr:isopeptide-forming domain-containing fimbrial protein [Lachnospiraceae bacterium]